MRAPHASRRPSGAPQHDGQAGVDDLPPVAPGRADQSTARREPPHAQATDLPLLQWRKLLRGGLVVMEAAPKRHQSHEDRQDGDQTHTHTSPL
jgi:hypothetical protein